MIFIKNMQPMVAFYESVFGMVLERTSHPDYVLLHSDAGSGIALHVLPAAVADCIELKTPPEWREHTAYKVCFEVSDLEAYRQRVLALGGQAKDPWLWDGMRFCECADPEGNVFQIFGLNSSNH